LETKLLQALNRQINHEFYGAYLYFAMSTYFDEIVMKGFSSFMKHKASEALSVAQKIYDYIILRDEKLAFSKIEEPVNDWINVSDIFSGALSHEEYVLSQTEELYKIATEVQDIPALDFISKLVEKQLQNVGCFRKLIFRIRNSNVISSDLEYLDTVLDKF
jgi:ferritin